MTTKMILTGLLTSVLWATSGCAVSRGQETVGAYIDDATITTQVKARFFENTTVAGSSISVETLNGVVMISGFAKSASEKSAAERIAAEVSGVKSVKNQIVIRP